jgi:5-deoxy-glucuronate isomerase
MTRDDALYVPKGIPITVQTASEADLVECFAPVEGDYPLRFVSGDIVRRDEKLHFVAVTAGRIERSISCSGVIFKRESW